MELQNDYCQGLHLFLNKFVIRSHLGRALECDQDATDD